MKIIYHRHLNQKLFEAWKDSLDNSEQSKVILTKRELEDLLYLWKNEAPKIWRIEDAVHAKDGGKE